MNLEYKMDRVTADSVTAASVPAASVTVASVNVVDTTFVQSLIKDIRSCGIDTSSAMTLIAKTMELAHKHFSGADGMTKKQYVMLALSEIAKGKDGVSGTEDDLIPEKTMNALKILIEGDLLEQTINIIWDAVKGRITLQEAAIPVVRNCCNILWALFRKE